MNLDYQLKQIIQTIKEGRDHGITSEEILGDIDQIRPPRIVEVEKAPVSSEEELEYLRKYRLEQKEIKKIKNEEEKKQAKIEKAKERVNFFCYRCKKNVRVENPLTNEANIIQKRNRAKKSIIISNKCPFCLINLNGFGGWA